MSPPLPAPLLSASSSSSFPRAEAEPAHMASQGQGHVHIEGLQTALPTLVVPPGRARPVSVSPPPATSPSSSAALLLQRRVRVVLYYRGDGAAWEEALWVKETLSEALAEHPEMAGRLRRRAGDGSAWEVKLNDTGIRLVLASADGSVDDFLNGEGRERREAALAPWTDVDAEDPDMCALCFLQLTRFQGDGGYALGVSCSLMLADPLSLARFLLSWARTHAEMKAQNKVATNPMVQYASYFQRPNVMTRRIKSIPIDSTVDCNNVETVLFRATGSPPDHRALARACIDQASDEIGAANKVSHFSVVVVAGEGEGDNPPGMSIEKCAADAVPESGGAERNKLIKAVQWQELGLEELALRGTKPAHVSYSIETGRDEGLAVVMPDGPGFLVTATVPK
ncbi:hypothetical protein PR202_ga02172 [Eleusine coracana subsp. coracana]|uniref:Uncharacterized protein n=1 Tax=Eleusine coracana subsp. coracana TaxID=191504 RepID=A0AAV5BLG8_ELECO|nr:hypothetical protein QOZ80_2AG0139460 [Eleusine coracana subsp. coracana]GJM86322.1 hypothetical protein PR202_ga02172 [Eleusine coracana subsp. coracana]